MYDWYQKRIGIIQFSSSLFKLHENPALDESNKKSNLNLENINDVFKLCTNA
jgi:hypothetical protein